MQVELKACAHCGGAAHVETNEAAIEELGIVQAGCTKCGALGPFVDADVPDAQGLAALAWNARFEASLPTSAPVDVFDWRGHWQPKIGSEVKVSERCAYYGEWQHDRLWVAGVSINRGGEGLNITVSHEWPQTSGGTDGFYINRPFQSDDLEPVGGFASLATPSVLAESTSNDCLLVAEVRYLRKALDQAQNTFEQIGLVAQGCASTHGDPGGGLEMIAGYGFDGFEITRTALSRAPAVTDLSGVGVG